MADEMEAESAWARPLRTGLISVLSMMVIAFGTIVFAAFQGHALVGDVAKYQTKNDERILALELKVERQRKQAEQERQEQAFFRGAVASSLGFLLPQRQAEDESR